jgi:hypothetical protein
VIAHFALGVVEGTDDDRVTQLGAVALRHADSRRPPSRRCGC